MSFSNSDEPILKGQRLDGTMVPETEPQYDAMTGADNSKLFKTMPIEEPVNDGQIVEGGSFDINLVDEFQPQEFDTNVITDSATAKEAEKLNNDAVTSRKVEAGDTVITREDNPEIQDVYTWKPRLNPESDDGQRRLVEMWRNVYMSTGDKMAANKAVMSEYYNMEDQWSRSENRNYWLNKGYSPDDIESWIDKGGDLKEPPKKSYKETTIQENGQSYRALINSSNPNDYTILRRASFDEDPDMVKAQDGGWLQRAEDGSWNPVISGKTGIKTVDLGDKVKVLDQSSGKVINTWAKGQKPAKESAASLKAKKEEQDRLETQQNLLPKVSNLTKELQQYSGATGPIDYYLNRASQITGVGLGKDASVMSDLESMQKDLFLNVKDAFGQMTDSDVNQAMKWYGLDPTKSADYNIGQLQRLERDLKAAIAKGDGGKEFLANLRNNAGNVPTYVEQQQASNVVNFADLK